MDYATIKNYVPKNRKWCKWGRCMYLQRFRGTIRIKYGYRYRHSRVMAVWYPGERFRFAGISYYPSQREKLNPYMPSGYKIISHRYYSFLIEPGKNQDDARAFYTRTDDRAGEANIYQVEPSYKWIWITKNGVKQKLGPTLQKVRGKLRDADIVRDLPRQRGRYWLRKARGVYRKPCGKSYYQGCAWRKIWPKPTTEWRGECGCHVYTKKAKSRDTVATIMAEENATVRTSKIQIYGVERFFTDAGAKQIDEEAGYKLITLDTGVAHQPEGGRWRFREQTANVVLTALRMECSTTGKVYVNTVPPQMNTVRGALDWMYETTNYLGRVSKQT